MSFKRQRRSLPCLPTSLTNPAGLPEEFKECDRISPVGFLNEHGRLSGRRSVSPVRSPPMSGHGRIKHQPSALGGFVGSPGLNRLSTLGSALSQHESLRRYHSSGCTYAVSSNSLNAIIATESAIKHQNSCPSNLGFLDRSLPGQHQRVHAVQSLHLNSSNESAGHSSGSNQHSDDNDSDLESKIYRRSPGLMHQGSIPSSYSDHPNRCTELHRSGRSKLVRQASMSSTLPPYYHSPNQLSPSSPQPDSPAPLAGQAGLRPCPPLQRNESMIYEEDVPVIVRRRGCMLRVRITSFVDCDDPEDGTTVSIIRGAHCFIMLSYSS